jgi:dipeptidyl-peptidase-4
MKRINLITPILLSLLISAQLFAQQPAKQSESGLLSLDTVFTYHPKSIGQLEWEADGKGYLMLEAAQNNKEALEIVRYDAATGDKATRVPADKLIPQGASSPLVIEAFDLSPDGRKLMIFTKSERVWRSNTRGDYWVLDLGSWRLNKLGGKAKPSTLMFAKFSPDGSRAAYVRENNIYVETLADGGIRQLTSDGSKNLVNGTFDWVYEEELFCRDGFRWSPDGKNIAYWQLNSEGVKEMKLINNTAGLYPEIVSFPYPKAGEMNSAARVGVVNAAGGTTRWFDIPGDPRNNYLPRMEWAAGSDEVIIQQLNRLQNTNTVMLGDVRTGKARTILTEKDDTWVDVAWGNIDWDKKGLARGDVEWLDGGKRFLWASERDGWRHIYSVSRDGTDIRCVTPGNYDVTAVEQVDPAGGWIYFIASPDNATQSYLFRARHDAPGKPERLSPANQPGSHGYIIAPRAELAVHIYSTFAGPPVTDIVRLPQHTAVRTVVDNHELGERLAKLKACPHEFFRVDIGEGVQLDGWMIKPPDFDSTKRYPVLFFVYGEPWSQTVVDGWGGDRQMWHLMLAQQGYIVASVDNRGTPAPRGRSWRKSIYRKMGVLNSGDQARAARVITKWPFIDPARVGIDRFWRSFLDRSRA